MLGVRAVCAGFGKADTSVCHLGRVVECDFDRDVDHAAVRSGEFDEFAAANVECGAVVEADVRSWCAGTGVETIGDGWKRGEQQGGAHYTC